jgi:hypothetical protein
LERATINDSAAEVKEQRSGGRIQKSAPHELLDECRTPNPVESNLAPGTY